jgi:hypothetical protein|tara:strand:+ start:366 stop:506 length:141 start_codon:yes stop_codon:yes gene_type:complete
LSFGGGGASGGKTKAHLHTNNSDDGGSLNSTSLINEAPLFTLMVAL